MKIINSIITMLALSSVSMQGIAQTTKTSPAAHTAAKKNMYLDVHQLGKVKLEDVAGAHTKDLAVEKKYGAHFVKYWVNQEQGLVLCLVSAPDSSAVTKTHAAAHGLLPEHIYKLNNSTAAILKNKKEFFLDVHNLGAGHVTAKDVAEAHKKDLAVQEKHGVVFVDYWVDEKKGTVNCLVQATDSASIAQAHKEAHGLIPNQIIKVQLGK